MKLTGQAEQDFKEWFIKQEYCDTEIDTLYLDFFLFDFYLPEAMKWGVYQDWFIQVGIKFWVSPFFNHDTGVMNEWAPYFSKGLFSLTYSTIEEARTEAIKKANEIYNNER